MSYIAVFMDRDGTICEEVGFLNDLSKLRLIEGSAEAIKLINHSGMKAVVVTNQSGVGRGFFTEDFVNNVHEKLKEFLRKEGAFLDGIYYCPHLPDVGCRCRKPETGMMQRASEELDIDLKKSYVIGDKAIDIEFAHRAGAKGVMVKTGYGGKEFRVQSSEFRTAPDYVADNLLDAVRWILEDRNEFRSKNSGARINRPPARSFQRKRFMD